MASTPAPRPLSRHPHPHPRPRRLRHGTGTDGTPRSSSGSRPSTGSISPRCREPAAADASASRTCSRFVEASPTEEPPLHIESPYRPEPMTPAPAPAAAPVSDRGGLSRMRRQIGEHMKRSLDTAATCTTWIEVDMSRVEAARARLGVTALAFVARAYDRRDPRAPGSERVARGREVHAPQRREPRDRGVAGRRRADRPGHPPRARAIGRRGSQRA